MGIKSNIISLAIIVFLANGCATVQTGKTSGKSKTYSEDLSAYRPEVPEEEPVLPDSTETIAIPDSLSAEVSQQLNTVLDTAAVYSRSTIKYIDGFTIQVYGGDNRARAKDYRMNLIRHFPETDPRTVFEQPNYKVRVGSYYTRLEAQHFYAQVKTVFPRAILIPSRIYIK
ncbi:MAG: hypothetical protein DRI71_06510 [Bacteroidetes bacterium]|nr:MAG: hypothetical protein DRI71_06510 [Bacteroidota bacterium]